MAGSVLDFLSNSGVASRIALSGDEKYETSLKSYFAQQQATLKPIAVALPESAEDVSRLLQALTQAGTQFSVRGGGHAQVPGASNSNGGVTIDLGHLKHVVVASDRKSVTVGGGARWGDVYTVLDKEGLGVAGGRQLDTGVGGLTLGGGISFHSPQVGFVCDGVLDFEVVLASGDIVHATHDTRADLWKALKGGSNNFGVVTAFTFRTFECGPVWGGTKMFGLDSAPQHLDAIHDFIVRAENDVHATVIQAFCYFNGPTAAFEGLQYTAPIEDPPVFKKFLDIQPVHQSTTGPTTILKLATEQSAFTSLGHSQALFSTSIKNDRRALQVAFDAWHESIQSIKDTEGTIWCVSIHAITKSILQKSAQSGGNVMGLAKSEPFFVLNLAASWDDASKDAFMADQGQRFIDGINSKTKELGAYHPYRYLNYSWEGVDVIGSYGEENKAFLETVSKKYDPSGLFQQQCTGTFKILR